MPALGVLLAADADTVAAWQPTGAEQGQSYQYRPLATSGRERLHARPRR